MLFNHSDEITVNSLKENCGTKINDSLNDYSLTLNLNIHIRSVGITLNTLPEKIKKPNFENLNQCSLIQFCIIIFAFQRNFLKKKNELYEDYRISD